MAVGLTQPVTRMNTRGYLLGVKGGRFVGLTTLLPSCADCLESWEPQPPGAVQAHTGIAVTFYN